MALIDIGSAAIDRGTYGVGGSTRIDQANPANATGKLTSVEIWANEAMSSGCQAATFYLDSGTTYITRDSEALGNITAGSKQTISGLDISVTSGDLIGEYHLAGKVEIDASGGTGMLHDAGDNTAPSTSAIYASYAGYAMSLYGTGATAGVTYDEKGRVQTVLATVEKAEQLTMVETYRSRPDQRYYTPLTVDHDRVGITQDLASNAASGQKNVVVQKGSVYGVGDSVVIKDTANREVGTVASVSSNTVTLVDNLTNSYTTANKAFLKNVTDSTDLTDFPCMFDEHDLPSTFWTKSKADGTDIAIYLPTGAKLKRELVTGSWDRDNHKMELHVKVPMASTTVDTILRLSYGYAAGAETNDVDTWDADFEFVSHMNDNPDTSHIKDSTDNGNNGIKTAVNEPVEAAGQVGKAQSFDGSNDRIDCGDAASLHDITQNLTVEYLVNPADETRPGPYYGILGKRYGPSSGNSWSPAITSNNSSGYFFVRKDDDSGYGYPATASWTGLTRGSWNYHAHVVKYNTYIRTYLAGILDKETNPWAGGVRISNEHLWLGYVIGYFKGLIGEVRISSIDRSVGWIATTNNTLKYPTTFYSVGEEVDLEQVILATVTKSDLATFNEINKVQTILAVITETDLQWFLEVGQEQVVLSIVTGNAYKRYEETGREQVVLAVITEVDAFYKYLAALGYILELHDSSGDLLAILENASDIDYIQTINTPYFLSFGLPADDDKVSNIILANEIWLRSYKTGVVIRKFRLGRKMDIRI